MKGMVNRMNFLEFYTGKCMNAYEFLGCHLVDDRAVFRTFAPAAKAISVIGDFNGWKETAMYKIHDGQFWECFISGVKEGMLYKYKIYTSNGSAVDHCDPYGFGMELRPNSASVVRNLYSYKFKDEAWLRKRSDYKDKPLNIYELHLGSWKTNPENENGWFQYGEIADRLIPYVKENGYNYVELMPIAEHPCDNSWGYQQTGFYSPTSRYGSLHELKLFIDKCHQAEIGVILDFVPVHFAVDYYALADYDGTALYEYPNTDVGFSEWGSKNFMHSRGEVQSFLQSSAMYWVKEYHFDGIRIDALSNIIYWHGNKERGVNNNAVEFIKHMNGQLKKQFPDIMLIAEDSTAFGGITKSVEKGGLGFDYKWDMGWMNDTLDYFRGSSEDRKREYHKLTFSMMYFYDENFLLPLSHDEVVHGKATILQKMNGDYDNKFPQARALYMYMYAHPGKKLNFMGNEIGQLREWDEKREQDWDIVKYPIHSSFARFMKDLNLVYLYHSALSYFDYDKKGFSWIDCHQESRCIYAFERVSEKERMIAVFNFSDEVQEYELNIKKAKGLKLVLASDNDIYGGNTRYQDMEHIEVKAEKAILNLAPFSGMYFRVV